MARLLLVLALVAAGVVGWAAFAPVTFDSREELFEIPKGTHARRMSGDPVDTWLKTRALRAPSCWSSIIRAG